MWPAERVDFHFVLFSLPFVKPGWRCACCGPWIFRVSFKTIGQTIPYQRRTLFNHELWAVGVWVYIRSKCVPVCALSSNMFIPWCNVHHVQTKTRPWRPRIQSQFNRLQHIRQTIAMHNKFLHFHRRVSSVNSIDFGHFISMCWQRQYSFCNLPTFGIDHAAPAPSRNLNTASITFTSCPNSLSNTWWSNG